MSVASARVVFLLVRSDDHGSHQDYLLAIADAMLPEYDAAIRRSCRWTVTAPR
jgi:hypothetical protein